MFDSRHFEIRDALRALRSDLGDSQQSSTVRPFLKIGSQSPPPVPALDVTTEIISYPATGKYFANQSSDSPGIAPSSPDQGGGGGGGAGTHPFKLVAFIPTGGTDYTIRVIYGMVNSLEPTGMAGGSNVDLLNVTSISGVVFVKVSFDSNDAITTIIIDYAVAIPADEINPSTGQVTATYLTLGSFSITDGVMSVFQVVTGSLYFSFCGRTVSWTRI